MTSDYLNSVNLNGDSDFPYLCMTIEKGKSIPKSPGFQTMHWHEDFQFIYVLTGEVYLHTLDQTKIVPSEYGVFLNKSVVHLISASPDCRYKSFLFPERLVSFYPGCPASKYVKQIADCTQITCIRFEPVIPWQKNILEILKQLSNITPISCTCYEYEVLTLLAALWLELAKNISVSVVPTHDLTVNRMQIFLRYIQENYAQDFTLDDLAGSAGVSKSECLRCFKLSIQDTPWHYLLEYRLQKAADLLRGTSLSIGEISQAVGFQSQSHFGKLFKEKTGCSPRDFRVKNK
ncbi:helix-turn-helix domain-containing protein [Feifania hominis]|uniref:Helix-turn-helix transcriptional regulator n=1 Tax=Feifania hominis TaxID=2763660 RepID=A0A926DF77_9FIRM|nr:AraC family transcriptional regulator [Feifania hominis]MBC8535920.1 helix-turn-helix transcriptional regulator [Feifania hominis]